MNKISKSKVSRLRNAERKAKLLFFMRAFFKIKAIENIYLVHGVSVLAEEDEGFSGVRNLTRLMRKFI